MRDNKVIQRSPNSQWDVVRQDKWLLSCLTWIPILLAFFIWWIFSQGIARDLPIGIVDLEHGELSRELIRTIDASPTLDVTSYYQSPSEAKQALVEGDVYGYAVIPRHYSRDVYLGNPPVVSVFYNSQYLLVGKLINSSIQQAHGTFNAKLGIAKQLSSNNTVIESAASRIMPIRNQTTPLFNKNVNYAQFLVSGIVPALWQICIVVSVILLLTANHRLYGLKAMLGDSPIRNIGKTAGFYIPSFLLLGFGFLTWFYIGFEWPFEGSLLTLMYAQVLTVVACCIMGSLFFFLTLDPARAMSFAGAYTAPSFAFMGVTFPDSDMSVLASIWRSLLPISHYIEIQTSQSSYAVTNFQALSDFSIGMCGYLIPMALLIPLCKKHLAKLEQVQ